MGVFLCIVALLLSGASSATGPVAYWPLEENTLDISGNGLHGENHGVLFEVPAPDGVRAARFDGIGSFFEVADTASLPFGSRDFTVSLEVYTEHALDDALGDLLCKFDADTRRGINFGLATYSGVSNSQPNYRTVFAGMDNGAAPEPWQDCGRPGNAIFVFGMAVHDGSLYAATCELGANERGRVYRYAGDDAWESCGSPDASNAVAALAVHDGHLYAGTSWYDTTGSALTASENTTPGGKVYRYDGGESWTYCGTLKNAETGEAATMGGLGVFEGHLYATTLKQDGFGLYRYEGGEEWFYCGNPGRRVLNPCAFNRALYMVSYDAPGGPFRYDGSSWAYTGGTINPPIHQDYSFCVYGGQLHVSTWPLAHVYRMDKDGVWTSSGRPGEELETMGMMVYNGKLYTGTLPSAQVYRLDGKDQWTPVGEPLDTSDNKYRRAWSMALYEGSLFCGTLPSGRVFRLDAGVNVTYDRALVPGWRHLVLVRQGNQLRFYVDGNLSATSRKDVSGEYDISNDAPLRIGFGTGDYFNGWMKQVRLYDSALTEKEIQNLCRWE